MRRSMIIAAVLLLVGCTSVKEYPDETVEAASSVSQTTAATTKASVTASSSSSSATTTACKTTTYIHIDDVIPQAVQTPKLDGERLSYTIINIYSEGEYYTMEVSGVRLSNNTENDIDTTYINDELYGDFRIDLIRDGEVLDSYKINIPRDDRFLILESAADGREYGCEVISNKREYNTNAYPDLLQLDFHIIDEVETPQYARYFSIYGQKIVEIPVLENGIEAAPHGTHLEIESEGVMTQHIVESDSYGNYYVQMYRYTFDSENRCLYRKKVNY